MTTSINRWAESWRSDPYARDLADRHYSRQSPGSKNIAPPGRCLIFLIPYVALWVTSWPQYSQHAWPGAWVCTLFRNERGTRYRSSELILEAIAATRHSWAPPDQGMITFVDPAKTKPKGHPGYCFRVAGFHVSGTESCCEGKPGHTGSGLLTLHMAPQTMPPAQQPLERGHYPVRR